MIETFDMISMHCGTGLLLTAVGGVVLYLLWGVMCLILRVKGSRDDNAEYKSQEAIVILLAIFGIIVAFWTALGWLTMRFLEWVSHRPG